MKEFKNNGHNETWEVVSGLHVSYNPGVSSLIAPDGSGGETALCSNGQYLILNGDWRKEYVEAFNDGGVDEMMEFYYKNLEHRSSWSTDVPIEEFAAGFMDKVSKIARG